MKQTQMNLFRGLSISLPLLCLALLFTPLFFSIDPVSAQAIPMASENINTLLKTQTTAVVTQTTSLPDWTKVTIDLSPYTGHEVELAFFLREVTTGEIMLHEPASHTVSQSPLSTDTASAGSLPLSLFLLPMMGLGSLALVRTRPHRIKMTAIGGIALLFVTITITNCIAVGPSPNFDPEALDVQGGELEIVIPAEHYIMNAQVSPEGTWLRYTYQYQSDNGRSNIVTNLLNIPDNKLYDKPLAGWSGAPWLDDNHMSAQSAILRLNDMVVLPKETVFIESIEEGRALLAGATQLFFVRDASRYSIQSTDPDYPYTIRFRPHELGCELGYEGLIACVEEMLSEGQTYQVRNSRIDSAAQTEMYSPDGAYYVYKDTYNDLTGRSGRGTSLFRTGETERLSYGYRYEWRAEFLGWAHDSSGAYILYRPKSALGDLTRSQYPIRKYLVPGAEARGLPTGFSPAPTPRWLPTPAVTPPISPTTSSDVPAPLVHTVPDNQLAGDTPWEIGWLSFLMLPAFMAVISAKRWRQLFESKIVRGLLVIGAVYLILTVCVYPFTPMAEISRSNELDEVRGGNTTLVVPSESGIWGSSLSPNNRWLIWSNDKAKLFVRDLTNNEEREITNIGGGTWVNENFLIQQKGDHYNLVEIPTLAQRQLPIQDVDSFTVESVERLFSNVRELYAVEAVGRNSAIVMISLDPKTPIAFEGPITTDFLSKLELSIVYVPRPWADDYEPYIAPNGRYYAQGSQTICCAFEVIDSETGEQLAFVRRDGRHSRIMGWSPDSSTLYFKFEVGGASGSILHPYEPVFKLVLDAAQSSEGSTAFVQPVVLQTSHSGWTIDDVVIEEITPPTVSLWIEDFPNHNSRMASGGGFDEIKLPSLQRVKSEK